MRQRANSLRFQEGETSVGGMPGKGLTKDIKLELGLDGRMGSGWVCSRLGGPFSCSDTVADSGEAETHAAVQRTLSKTGLAWVKASLQQRLHNPKPGKDDRPWNVWHCPDCQGWWPRQAQVSMSIRTRAHGWLNHTFHFWKLQLQMWKFILAAGRLPSGLVTPICQVADMQSACWSHAVWEPGMSLRAECALICHKHEF